MYLGAFNQKYRELFIRKWMQQCADFNIPLVQKYKIQQVLSDNSQIMEWQECFLPTDLLSEQNAVIIQNCIHWPYIIDPQSQANIWIRNFWKVGQLVICKMNDSELFMKIEQCIRFGKPFLIENVEEWLDPILDSVFQKDIYKKGFNLMIKLGDIEVQYN